MQNDYFNKLQGGSSLFMKSDHDGEKDAQSRVMPLGIKSVAQGIEHFTDWKGVSDTIEKNNLANFEDSQPNALKFSQSYVPHVSTQSGFGTVFEDDKTWNVPRPVKDLESARLGVDSVLYKKKTFQDEWSANKVKVLDDLAFVAYEEYTDIHRSDIELDDLTHLRQYSLKEQSPVVSNTLESTTSFIGGLVGSTNRILGRKENINYEERLMSDQVSESEPVASASPLHFSDYHNSILKIEFITGDTAYFTYGGAYANDLPINVGVNYEKLRWRSSLGMPTTTISPNGEVVFAPFSTYKDGRIWGSFSLVVRGQTSQDGPWSQKGKEDAVFENRFLPPLVNIQLSLYAAPASEDDSLSSTFVPPAFTDEQGVTKELYEYKIAIKSAKLIKIQPVRKCGKVDIYTKKRSIISSVVNNSLTSNNHNLNTNDIIEISNALFDGSQNGVADVHPLNGNKYVRVVDNDTFEIFDDKFFKDPSFTGKLKTTDGITWKCVSNNFDSIGQSWDYHGTMFSPTGRNGYKFIDRNITSYEDSLAHTDEFFTTNRFNDAKNKFNDPANKSCIDLDFHGSSAIARINSTFAKDIDDTIKRSFKASSNTPDKLEDFYTPLDDPERAFWDFYPFDCQNKKEEAQTGDPAHETVAEYEEPKLPYWGSRFGCDLDIKFSHKSGSSRVYTVGVGERGSDVSVDLFGIESDRFRVKESPFYLDVLGNGSYEKSYKWNRCNVVPWSLPHGKTHLFTITVDQYNRISDISHANTLFGGGYSIVDDSSHSEQREYNPWYKSQLELFRPSYRLYQHLAEESLSSYNLIRPNENEGYHHNSEKYHTDSDGRHVYNSSYWLRSAVVHWIGHNINDYRVENYEERQNKLLREFPKDSPFEINRKTLSIKSNKIDNRSRFGFVGFGGDPLPIDRIDRYDEENSRPSFSQDGIASSRGIFYIFPWVDSFGKSVAIENNSNLTSVDGYSDSSPKTILVSASTCKSNIEYNESDYSIQLASRVILQEESDATPTIGQLQANFIYVDGSSYKNIDFSFLNSGGSDCGRLFNNLTLRRDPDDIEQFRPNHQRVLKTGSLAGFGMPEAITSCSLSALTLQWHENQLVWVDQNLYDGRSVVNILRFTDGQDQSFQNDFSFSKSFIDSRDANLSAINTGDGFGIDFKYAENIFVTNARSTTTELGHSINVGDKDRLDYIHVYERINEDFKQTQKISASINKNDEDKYSLHLLTKNEKLLYVPGSVNYDNSSLNSLTWDIDFGGRYDLVNNKILIKDPLEYSLFSRNYSIKEQSLSSNISEEYADLYLAISENAKIAPKKSNSTLNYDYISADVTEYSCRQTAGVKYSSVSNTVPFFFFKIPVDDLDVIRDLTINFDIVAEDIFSSFDLKGVTSLADQTDNIIPRVVLYGRDPRMTIIENGPADRGSSSDFPKYENGIWTEIESINEDGEYYSYDFPGWYRGGAQDMFFYGRDAGSRVRTGSVQLPNLPPSYLYGGEVNLGDFYDLSSGTRLSGDAGDPAWLAHDVYQHISPEDFAKVQPYAKIFLPQADTEGYSVTIPRDTLKDFIITQKLLKDSNRPTSIVSGFNDTANAYDVQDIDNSIIIGFLLTNVNDFDIKTGVVNHEEPSNDFDIGAIRYISNHPRNEKSHYVNAKYPYCSVVNYYSPSFNGNRYSGSFLEYDLRSTIKSLSVIVSKNKKTQNRYSNKFHKIAVFAYDQESVEETRQSYSNFSGSTEFEAFGRNRLLPVPSDSNKNPIISIGKKSQAFDIVDDSEILTTENISSASTSYHINVETGEINYNVAPTGSFVGVSKFDQASLLGGFDLDDDRFLSLSIKSNPREEEGIPLTNVGNAVHSGVVNLSMQASAGQNNAASLWTGTFFKENDTTLFTFTPHARPMSLFVYEVQPSSVMSLFNRGPDFDGAISLAMNKPTSGVVPLSISGPVQDAEAMTLAWVPSFSGVTTMAISGLGFENNNATLFTDAVFASRTGIPLTFSPGVSGDISLFLARNLEASGDVSLVMPNVLGVDNAAMPLKISKNTHEEDTELFIKSQEQINKDASLYVNSQVAKNNEMSLAQIGPLTSNADATAYMRSIFPSGEMTLAMKTIDRLLATGINLHIENTQFTMPLHINQVLNPSAPLLINGLAIADSGQASLYIKSLTLDNDADLSVAGISSHSGDISAFVKGSTNKEMSGNTTLFIGKEINANENTSLFVYNDVYSTSLNATGVVSDVTASISGGLGSGHSDDSDLYLKAPPVGSGYNDTTLLVRVEEPVIGSGGGVVDSGVISTIITGNNDAGVYFRHNAEASLNIVNRSISSGDTTLFLHRPEENVMSLNISSLYNNNQITTSISGANAPNNNITLNISPPQSSGIDMFTRGYLE